MDGLSQGIAFSYRTTRYRTRRNLWDSFSMDHRRPVFSAFHLFITFVRHHGMFWKDFADIWKGHASCISSRRICHPSILITLGSQPSMSCGAMLTRPSTTAWYMGKQAGHLRWEGKASYLTTTVGLIMLFPLSTLVKKLTINRQTRWTSPSRDLWHARLAEVLCFDGSWRWWCHHWLNPGSKAIRSLVQKARATGFARSSSTQQIRAASWMAMPVLFGST